MSTSGMSMAVSLSVRQATCATAIKGRKVNYRFDKSNRLADICNEIDQSIVKFTRDADGAIQKITHANGMWKDIAYDADKNIKSLTIAAPDKLLAQNTYRYDGNSQRIEKNELTGMTQINRYDAEGLRHEMEEKG